MKEIWIDCETTGLDSKRHGVIELAAHLFSGDVLVDVFEYAVAPFSSDEIDEKALMINGHRPEIIYSYAAPLRIVELFGIFLDKHKDAPDEKYMWYGFNPRFDYDMLSAWFEKAGQNDFGRHFSRPLIDVWALSVWAERENRAAMDKTNLSYMAKWYGVDTSACRLHSAAGDIVVTRKLYEEILKKTGERGIL